MEQGQLFRHWSFACLGIGHDRACTLDLDKVFMLRMGFLKHRPKIQD